MFQIIDGHICYLGRRNAFLNGGSKADSLQKAHWLGYDSRMSEFREAIGAPSATSGLTVPRHLDRTDRTERDVLTAQHAREARTDAELVHYLNYWHERGQRDATARLKQLLAL